MQDSQINKQLDKAVSNRHLDPETRNLCSRLLREGNDAQVLRAVAVLTYLGEPTHLPTNIMATGSWPNLPSKEVELKTIYSLVKHDRSLNVSFIAALLSRSGPSNKLRETFFWDFAEQEGGNRAIAGFVNAVTALGRALRGQNTSASNARKRLIEYATKELKKHGRDSDGVRTVFGSLSSLYELSSSQEKNEAVRLVSLLLSQVKGQDALLRVRSLRDVISQFRPLESLFRLGWVAPKIGKADALKSTQLADDAIVYACLADGESDRDFAKWLLSITLQNQSVDEWLGKARGSLGLMQTGTTTNDHVLSMLQVIHETGVANDVSFADVQDSSPEAAKAVIKVVKVLTTEIRRLTHENAYLKSPESVRKSAGNLIDEELRRQGELMGKLQEHVKQKREELAERLRVAVNGLTGSSRSEIDGVVADVIAFLEGRS